MMTTSAAILGAVPLALSFGNGGEIRRPLGIAIVGGLIISQLLTLYTTPVLYLYLDRLGQWSLRQRQRLLPGLLGGSRTTPARMPSAAVSADVNGLARVAAGLPCPTPADPSRARKRMDIGARRLICGPLRRHRHPDWLPAWRSA